LLELVGIIVRESTRVAKLRGAVVLLPFKLIRMIFRASIRGCMVIRVIVRPVLALVA
jgi:hypothetical protein